jgi:pyruvate kinase
VVAKIEERRGVQNLKSILEVSDAIMVARGDLGVCMPREEVPLLQERIIKACRKKGKPVIVATQMLESMVSNRTPTRAEVTDVAQAVLQGADALMLSAETAVGKYPVEAVRELATIIDTVERSEEFRKLLKSREYYPEIPTLQQSICMAMDIISESAQVRAIVVETDGRSAKLLSSYRPLLPIYAAVPDETVARSLLLWWGVKPMVGTVQEVIQKLKASGILKERDKVLVSRHIVRTPFEAELKVVES